jgi:hypothetical protein
MLRTTSARRIALSTTINQQQTRTIYSIPHITSVTSDSTLHRGHGNLGEAVNKSKTLYVFKKRDVKQITLNNPRNLNRLTPKLAKQLHKELMKGVLNPINKMVVFRSTGATHLLGGSDLHAIYDIFYGESVTEQDKKNPMDISLQNFSLYMKDLYSLSSTLIHSSRITPLWNGHSVVPLPNSLLGPGASFHVPHLQYGMAPDMGTTWLLGQLDLKYPGVGMYMALFSSSKKTILNSFQLSALGIGKGEVNEGSFDQMMMDYQFSTATLEPLDKMLKYVATPTLANNLEKIDPVGVGVKTGYGFSTTNIVNLPLQDIEEYFGAFTDPSNNTKDHMTLNDLIVVLERDSNDLSKGTSKRQWCSEMVQTLRSGSLEVAGGVFALTKNIRGRSFTDCCTMEYRLLHRLLHDRNSDTHRALKFLHDYATKQNKFSTEYQAFIDPQIWKTGDDINRDIELRMNEPLNFKDDKGIDFAVGGPMEMESMRTYMEKLIEVSESQPQQQQKNKEAYLADFKFEVVNN